MQSSYTKHNISDHIGKKYGHLTVVGQSPKTHRYSNKFDFQCDCGKIISEEPTRVLTGHKKTCGCRCPKPKIKSDHYGNYKDGRTKHPLYGTWIQMISRCENPKNLKYGNYGGRGISVCDDWHDFWSFAYWSEQNNYSKELTLDRINPNGNYEPSNCRWADWETQSNNKTSCKYITYKGETHTIKQWSKILGINSVTLKNRIYSNWDLDVAFTTKPQKGNNQHKIS